MKQIKKMLCLVLFAVLLISAASAIVEHSKQETVERMKGGPLQSAGDEGMPISGAESEPGPIETVLIGKEMLPAEVRMTQDYLISGYNLTSRPSYLVTESGQTLTITWIDENVGYIEGNPAILPLGQSQDGLKKLYRAVSDAAAVWGCYDGCKGLRGSPEYWDCVNNCIRGELF